MQEVEFSFGLPAGGLAVDVCPDSCFDHAHAPMPGCRTFERNPRYPLGADEKLGTLFVSG